MEARSKEALNIALADLKAEYDRLEDISEAAELNASNAGYAMDAFVEKNGGRYCECCRAVIWPGEPISTARYEREFENLFG